MDPTCVVVRNAFHTITKPKPKGEDALYANLEKLTYSAVLKYLCRWLQMKQWEIHTTLNCMPDQDDGTEDVPRTSSDSSTPTVTSITFKSRFTDRFSTVGLIFFFFLLRVCVNTKSQSSLEYCSAAIYRIAKQTIWLIYTQYLTLSRDYF